MNHDSSPNGSVSHNASEVPQWMRDFVDDFATQFEYKMEPGDQEEQIEVNNFKLAMLQCIAKHAPAPVVQPSGETSFARSPEVEAALALMDGAHTNRQFALIAKGLLTMEEIRAKAKRIVLTYVADLEQHSQQLAEQLGNLVGVKDRLVAQNKENYEQAQTAIQQLAEERDAEAKARKDEEHWWNTERDQTAQIEKLQSQLTTATARAGRLELAADCIASLAKLITNDDGVDPEAFWLELDREQANLIKDVAELAEQLPALAAGAKGEEQS